MSHGHLQSHGLASALRNPHHPCRNSLCALTYASRGLNQAHLTAPCYVPDSWYPIQTCRKETSLSACVRGFNAYATEDICCSASGAGAFPGGCSSEVAECWVAGTYYPTKTCTVSRNATQCAQNWGQWTSQDDCCAPGAAFAGGCYKVAPCWAATQWYPKQACSQTDDQSVCQRGWGAYASKVECCSLGHAFSGGCTA
ncbi:hypothetical protein ACKKBG_A32935 [Auxenochlorella protothecoides x Auxenochlorella symbiontica]